MKRNLAYALFVMLIAVASCSFTNNAPDNFENDDKDKLLLDLITYVLEKIHYDPIAINDDFSVGVFEDFIEIIDPTKRFFIQEDIEEFEQYKYQIDEQVKNTDIVFFNIVYDRLMLRMEEAKDIYEEVLETPFDYNAQEIINVDYKNLPYAQSKKALKERWRKQLKYITMGTYDGKLTLTDKAPDTEKVMVDGTPVDIEKPDVKVTEIKADKKPLTPKEAEEAARKITKKTLYEYFDFIDDLQRKDWFVQYLNTIVDEFDPHTYYFAPDDKEKFDASMSGKFEGIGARLQKKPEGAKVTDIISGGPVWRDARIEVGDVIIKVGQKGKDPVDIVGMRLDDAIKMIKGPEGTVVDLTIRKIDGSTTIISLTRDVVELEESFAKSANILKDTEKFGLIHLPKFYVDFNDYTERNAATDVAKEVERLKEEGMEGLILDLRDNGGGSLKTVVKTNVYNGMDLLWCLLTSCLHRPQKF